MNRKLYLLFALDTEFIGSKAYSRRRRMEEEKEWKDKENTNKFLRKIRFFLLSYASFLFLHSNNDV